MTIVYILLAWVAIGLVSGLIIDYTKKDDTRLKDILAYSVLGLVTLGVGIVIIFQEKISWNKVIFKNSERTTNKVKILDKN